MAESQDESQETKDVVYLDDVETNRTKKPGQPTGDKTASNSTAGNKRQRSIAEMFGGGAQSSSTGQNTEPAAKRLKASASASSSQSRIGSAGTQDLKLNAIPFSLTQFQESLSDEARKLLALECAFMGKSWLKLLKDEIRKPYFITLKRFLWEQGVRGPDEIPATLTIFPSPSNIYTWSNTPLGKVKVVIIGQDPYHGPGQAHGLSFSVPLGVPIPPSLRNIYKEIKTEYPSFEPPKHGNLTHWADNGVLLLNTSLTVKAASAGSHQNKGWENFTTKVVDVVDRYGGANLGATDSTGFGRGVVFLAWGKWAIERVSKLDKAKHLILTSPHPSPLSASKGFFGNGHFKKANDWLIQKYGEDSKVDWCSLPMNTQK